jgi:hypothetical protein
MQSKSHVRSEHDELVRATRVLEAALDGVRRALANWPSPVFVCEHDTVEVAAEQMGERLDDALDKFLHGAGAAFRKRADEAGMDPDAFPLRACPVVRRPVELTGDA